MSWNKHLVLIATCTILAMGIALPLVAEYIDVPPRSLAPYVERRASGHNPFIVEIGQLIGDELMALDRGDYLQSHRQPLLRIGAQSMGASLTNAAPAPAGSNEILISSPDQAIQVIAKAQPGDVITFLPGTYRFTGDITVSQPGAKARSITVRAGHPGTVHLEMNALQGFVVSAPYWTFENLHIRGVCQDHSNCEHAFHVVGKATHFVSLNNTIADFNAHFKINGEDGFVPDFGRIEGNTLTNSSVRQTDKPVTLIDLVAASHWVIRKNAISDFVKAQGDQISYGAFAKGGGADNRFEQNVVLCEHLLQGSPGQRVGLSLGGGGTGKLYCRDKRCITEQDGSVIQSNLIASCSDDGIYINRAATSKIMHNTLIDTGGIMVRFVESSADIEGNLVDGAIRTRDGGLLRPSDNMDTSMTSLYVGRHPVRQLFSQAQALDLQWRTMPRRGNVAETVSEDLCGKQRPAQAAFGAFENFPDCLR